METVASGFTDTILSIDTATIPLADKRSTSDFTVRFATSLRFPNIGYNLCLLKLNTFYAIHNFDQAKYANCTISVFYTDSLIENVITIPNGIYNFETFVETVEKLWIPFAFATPPITFSVNRNTGKFTMKPTGDWNIRISKTLSIMFGLFDKSSIPAPWQSNKDNDQFYLRYGVYESIYTPEWNMGVVSLSLECDATMNSLTNGRAKNVIASFVPRAQPYGSIEYEPINLTYLQIRDKNISAMTFRLTDQSGEVVKLNDEMSLLLAIRPFGM